MLEMSPYLIYRSICSFLECGIFLGGCILWYNLYLTFLFSCVTIFRACWCIMCEASLHERRLKCDTNISPRRLITHLLHQMVHHRTTLRGNGQWSATIARTTTKTQTRMWTTKRSSESCAIRSFLRVTLSTGKIGCRTEPLLNVLGNKVWIFLCKS